MSLLMNKNIENTLGVSSQIEVLCVRKTGLVVTTWQKKTNVYRAPPQPLRMLTLNRMNRRKTILNGTNSAKNQINSTVRRELESLHGTQGNGW